MLPSLVAEELRHELTSFLGTTFALADEDVRAELERFISDAEDGVFRGPYVRLRLPFRPAEPGFRDLLGFTPHRPVAFTPHRHQAQAWERLSSATGVPEPTIVTTGTGSGKTESFLVPLLDHCQREHRTRGIKAIVLYPMNALANDQARRIAGMVHAHRDELPDVTVGLYTGDGVSNAATMTETSVITNRQALRAHPPDILLTNYKMLDMLLLRSDDTPLFAGAAEALRYLVLDEFHTYDGAQGTDVAMLLRRLGLALGTAGVDGPLTGITPVATSATLGTGASSGEKLREFAETVFGRPFEADALVGEDRLTAAEWSTGPDGAVPLLAQVTDALSAARSHDDAVRAAAQVFLGTGADDPAALGAALRAHPLTRRLLELTGQSRPLAEVAEQVEPGWASRPAEARAAVSAYLALLSRATTELGRPLLGVDVQLWLREVRRVVRRLDAAPEFRWWDGSPAEGPQLMSAVFCRHCGRSGWGATATPGGGWSITADTTWKSSVADPTMRRTWIFAPGEGAAGDTRVQWADGETGELATSRSGGHSRDVPVLVTPDGDAAKADQCPSCGLNDGIRFLGSSVATLASAALGQVFASPDVEPRQKKTLVFTDSVQDASHRAAFIESRAYVLNRRSLLLRAIDPAGTTLDQVGAAVAAGASTDTDRYAVLPPDLKHHERFQRYWQSDMPDAATRRAVARLLGFSATLELGLSARVGRTLELTGAATAHVHVPSMDDVVGALGDAVQRAPVQIALLDTGAAEQLELSGEPLPGAARWARGVLERMRLQGGIEHPWLEKYVRSGGDRHSIWGGRPRYEGMPAFPRGRPAPSFPTTAKASESFDTVIGPKGWYAQWTARALGIPTVDAPRYLRLLLDALTTAGVLTAVTTTDGHRVWTIPPGNVQVQRTTDAAPPALRCAVCSSMHPATAAVVAELDGAPCLRVSCSGHYRRTTLEGDYYRDLYRAGQVRRIVAREHTSLLRPEARVALEGRFKTSEQAADDPNVLTCTPTLELGIDIGDLSMVALTSLPRSTASYLQRVGRAGRLTGSSLVLSLLPARPLELQRLLDPLTMIAGDVVPPACYLDAVEILRRQYLASLVDRQARHETSRPLRRAVEVFAGGLTPASWLGRLVADARTHADTHSTEFLAAFGTAVTKETQEELRRWAGVDLPDGEVSELERDVERACTTWQDEMAELEARRVALDVEVTAIEALPSLDEAQTRDLRRVRGELGAIRRGISERRSVYWISVLEDLGLLPNYALLDDSTQLDVGLWWTDEETGAAEHSDDTYVRGSRTALRELAPGATFYVQGTSLEIDGLDLGTSRNPATEDRRFCPSCGWSGPASVTIARCPRCDDVNAADVGQVLRTLPFRKASAYASRELAQRDDDTDDRRRTSFTIATTVDADPAHIRKAWGLEDYQFGAEVLDRADLRWINLGPSARHGAAVTLAGDEHASAQFEACTHCGVVWAAQRGVRAQAEARHRGWCRQRKAPDTKAWTTVVLTHHLRTQAVRLLVPPVVLVDKTLLTSFRAALLLGLREVLGGDPDHLDVVTAVDPSPGTVDRWAMVLHDTVPGGTGYLARFGDPEEVQRLLQAALDALVRCPCGSEDVAACHRCLLPHVAPQDAPLARRDRAMELLTEILGSWLPKEIESLRSIEVGAHDTPIERRFRDLLVRWAKSLGSSVSAHATSWGDRVEMTLPKEQDGLRWSLTPQVNHGFVKPDFDLRTDDPEVPTIAVFCDGVRWHAHAAKNRVAEDARNRHELRQQGLLVWAVTHQDLDAFEAALDTGAVAAPSWASAGVVDRTAAYGVQLCGAGSAGAPDLLADPITLLTRLMTRPRPTTWEPAARSVALAVLAGSASATLSDKGRLPSLVRSRLLEEAPSLPSGADQLLLTRTPAAAVLGAVIPSKTHVEVVLGVDDGDEVVGTDRHLASWREWLSLGNVVQLLGADRSHVGSVSTLVETTVVTMGLAPEWREIAGLFGGSIAQLVSGLAPTGVPLPEPGLEVNDGDYSIDLAWPDEKVAVLEEPEDERDAWLVDRGWTLVPATVEDVCSALHVTEGAVP